MPLHMCLCVLQAKDCVRRMLVRDPRKRPDAQTILKHEWLRGGAGAPEAPMQPEILNRMKRFAGMNRFKKEALRVRHSLCCTGGPSSCLRTSCQLRLHMPNLGSVRLVCTNSHAPSLLQSNIQGFHDCHHPCVVQGRCTVVGVSARVD
jgi:serine/threonine protein kinase